MNYYNEWDAKAAAWLRELITRQLIPYGYVDERSITDVTPGDLEGFTQCHFFAGIGGWSLALQLAGVPASTRLWTGSPPCQPFSVAGQSLGFDDQRHLAPAFLRLIRECKPEYFFGEQVAAAISKHWLDFVFLNLEEQGYACGAVVLPACSVGAPHKRDRLFFGASLRLGDAEGERQRTNKVGQHRGAGEQLERAEPGEYDKHRCADGELADSDDHRQQPGSGGGCCSGSSCARDDAGRGQPSGGMAHTDDTGSQGRRRVPECADKQSSGPCGMGGPLAQPNSEQQRQIAKPGQCDEHVSGGWVESTAEATGLCGHNSIAHAESQRQSHGRAATILAQFAENGREDSATRPDTNHSYWSGADWLGCRDGKFRPVEPGTFPLANGVPARVGRLCGYGNAIVPQVAAEFIGAFFNALSD